MLCEVDPTLHRWFRCRRIDIRRLHAETCRLARRLHAIHDDLTALRQHPVKSEVHKVALACEAGVTQAREASDTIKPGAQAPGLHYQESPEPATAATALCRPFHGLQKIIS